MGLPIRFLGYCKRKLAYLDPPGAVYVSLQGPALLVCRGAVEGCCGKPTGARLFSVEVDGYVAVPLQKIFSVG